MVSMGRRGLIGLGIGGLAAGASVGGAAPASASPSPQGEALADMPGRVWRLDPSVAGPEYTPTQRREHIHDVLAQIAAAGGGTLEWPGVEYVVDRPPDTYTPEPSTAASIWGVVPANTLIRGRAGSALTLDPATTPTSTGMTVLHFGPLDGSGSNITIEGLTVTCNASIIGGGSIWAIGSRRAANNTERVDNISVRNCTVQDCRIAVCATQRTPQSDLGQHQHRNWRIENCDFRKCSNRMVELSQVDGGLVTGNQFTDAETAVHLISFTRNVAVIANRGTVLYNAIMVNFGVEDCDVIGNRFEYASGSGAAGGSLQFHSEPRPAVYTVERVRFKGNTWPAGPAGASLSLTFHLRAEQTDVTWRDITFDGDVFEGSASLVGLPNPAAGEALDIEFTDCIFGGGATSAPSATYNLHDVRFHGCRFEGPLHTVEADRVLLQDNWWKSGLAIGNTAHYTVAIGNVTPEPVDDQGTASQLVSNVVWGDEPDTARPSVTIDVSAGIVTVTATDQGQLRRIAANLYDEHNSQLISAIGSTSASTPLAMTESQQTWSLPSDLAPGTYTVRASASDISNNTGVTTARFTVES